MTKLPETNKVTLSIWLSCTVLKWFDKNYSEKRKERITKVVEYDYLSDLSFKIPVLKKQIEQSKNLIKPDAVNKIVTDIQIDSIEIANETEVSEDVKAYLSEII